MIDREQVLKLLDVMDALEKESATLEIKPQSVSLRVYPAEWWGSGKQWTDEQRHQYLALVTPLVGKMEKVADSGNIGYYGKKENLEIKLNYVDKCKVIGYKTVKKTVEREIVPAEYETVIEEFQEPITDCDVRSGKESPDDIEVPA